MCYNILHSIEMRQRLMYISIRKHSKIQLITSPLTCDHTLLPSYSDAGKEELNSQVFLDILDGSGDLTPWSAMEEALCYSMLWQSNCGHTLPCIPFSLLSFQKKKTPDRKLLAHLCQRIEEERASSIARPLCQVPLTCLTCFPC